MQEKWELVAIVEGELQAEIMRGLLEAQGISVYLAQEAAAKIYGLNIGSLSEVKVMVKTSDLPLAQSIYADYKSGRLTNALPGEFDEPI